MSEHAGWSGENSAPDPDAIKQGEINALNHAILDADRYLEKYNRLRDDFVERLLVLTG